MKDWRRTVALLGGASLLVFAPFGAAIDLPVGLGLMLYAVISQLRDKYNGQVQTGNG